MIERFVDDNSQLLRIIATRHLNVTIYDTLRNFGLNLLAMLGSVFRRGARVGSRRRHAAYNPAAATFVVLRRAAADGGRRGPSMVRARAVVLGTETLSCLARGFRRGMAFRIRARRDRGESEFRHI